MQKKKKKKSEWKSKGLSDDSIKPLSLLIDYVGGKIRLKFKRSCLKQPKLTYTHRKTVNIYIVYEIGASSSFNDYPKLKSSLFDVVRLTKNANIDIYRGYGIRFDRRSSFSLPDGEFGRNVMIFGVDMSSSVHVDNKKRTFQFLEKVQHKG